MTCKTRFLIVFSLISFLTTAVFAQAKSGTWELRSDSIELLSTLQFVLDTDLKKDLEVLDWQYDHLTKLKEELHASFVILSKNRSSPDKQILMQSFYDVSRRVQTDLEETLLPHQLKRMKEILLQRRLASDKKSLITYWILDPSISRKLKLTEIEQKKIEDIAEDLWKETEVEIEQLRRKILDVHERARDKLLSRLSSRQKKIYLERIGKLSIIGK